MAATQTAEQRELALIGKVEMRIALTDTDEKLQTILKTYLAPLLLKLASEHVSVRNKVISICQHINTRVKPESVQLPVAALIQQFKEQQSSLVRHFDILYIQQGIDRLSSSEKAALLPLLIGGITDAGQHAPQIFNLFLRLLEHFVLPLRGSKEDSELRSKYQISTQDAHSIAHYLGKLILFVPQRTSCPGLSKEDCDFLSLQSKPETWSPSLGGLNLLRTKMLALRLLSSGFFIDMERFLPALFATADTASTISELGDDLMKRTLPSIDLESVDVLQPLFDLYLGKFSGNTITARTNTASPFAGYSSATNAPRASSLLQIKILALLNRSTTSISYGENVIKIAEDGINIIDNDGEDIVMTNTRSPPGRQTLRLRTAVFEYINFVARYGTADVLHSIAPRLVSRFRDFIENQGWPAPGINEDLGTRAYAYEVIGLLIKAGPPSLIIEPEHSSADLLRWLFTALASDKSGGAVIVSIEEAISTVLGTLSHRTISKADQAVLEDLLVEQILMSEDPKAHQRLRSTRFAAVRFANRCLPFDSVKARWIDIMAVGADDERMEVKEESERGLSPYWYLMLKGINGMSETVVVSFPTFTDLIAQFFPHSKSNEDAFATAQRTQNRYSRNFAKVVSFLRRILIHEATSKAKLSPAISSEWERNLDTLVANDFAVRTALKAHLTTDNDGIRHSLRLFQAALFDLQINEGAHEDSYLVEYLAHAPDSLVEDLVPHAEALIMSIMSNDHNARIGAAHSFGILVSSPTCSQAYKLLDGLLSKVLSWKSAVGAQVNQVHGCIAALGFAISRRSYRLPDQSDVELVHRFITELSSSMVEHSLDSTLQSALCSALGQLSVYGVLKYKDFASFKAIAEKVYVTAKTGDEKAIICLGQLGLICCDGADEGRAHIEARLHDLHEVRQAEVHFSTGEAFSYLAAGWTSQALATKFDLNTPLPNTYNSTGMLEKLTSRFVKDCASTKPSLKKAAVMWLLCLVQYCGHLPEMQSQLGLCQQAFKTCLVDRDELVQETASRGLGLVYENGDRNIKDDLVRDLVSSFSSDKPTGLAGTVSADTQLFEPGTLPTGDGSVSTYKDIMSLASEVGDSSLVYRFMSMASSNAVWSSRAAFGRFGLSNVLSDSSVDGYLSNNPKLYPKLYRYRFDPNTGVRRSMNDIWNALVKDSAVVLSQHFDAIIKDLLISILGKEWRVRQASCAAIADLLQGQPLSKYEIYLEDIWDKCFKVLDDIKESVRAAAATLARSLTGILTRSLESDHSANKTASAMLKHVLPFLLSPSGMESSAQEVQLFAVHTLLEIIKKSNGQTIRPFIPDLVERLISLLSSMEPEAVNYIHLNATKYNLTEQKIDNMRLSSVRSSPIMEAIERCLDLLDDDTMQRLQPRLEHAMRNAVGLPSKVGASRVLVSLSTRRAAVFKPSADHFLKVIEKLVLDRNETVASSYAAAAGYVARHASEKHFLRLATFVKDLYFKSEGDREAAMPRKSISSGELVYALVKHANDRFNAVAASFLPLVYFGKHDDHVVVKEQFQKTWSEAVGGARAVQLYLQEILTLVKENLDSAQWTLKHTAARSIADATNSIIKADRSLSNDTAAALWPVIEKALGGKTWEGKEVVLEAFVQFVEQATSFYQNKPDVAAMVVKIAIREAKRNNYAYRQHAMRALAKIAAAREDIDLSQSVQEVAISLIDELQDRDPMDVDGTDGSKENKTSEIRERTLAAAIEALFMSVNPRQSMIDAAMRTALAAAVKIGRPTAPIRKATYQAMQDTFEKLANSGAGTAIDAAECSEDIRQLLFGPDPGSEALRLLRADAVLQIARSSPSLAAALRSDVAKELQEERSQTVLDRLATCLAALAS